MNHPAYAVWHSLADRRKEFELPLFSTADISKLLGGLSSELKQPISLSLRKLLVENCQGYPWLLKKLCIHVFQVLRKQPEQQRELLERALDVESLFNKDLEDLGSKEFKCLEAIAENSPADNYQIENVYGDQTIAFLIQRRLVVRNAGKLILYWDIFRDYVLTKQVPSIPSRYIPVSTPSTAKRVFFALSTNDFSVQTLANNLARKRGTIDNIARDLVMMGVAVHDRKKGLIKLAHESTEQSLSAMFRFFNSHLVIRKVIEKFGNGFSNVGYHSFEEIVRSVYSIGDFQEKTIRVRTLNIMAWLEGLGIVFTETNGAIQHQASAGVPATFYQLKAFRETTNTTAFRGLAPPARVLEVLNRLKQPDYKYQDKDRNPINELRSLRIISTGLEPVFLEKPTNIDTRIWLANKVLRQQSIKQVQAVIRNSPEVSDLEIGQALEIFAGLSDATKKRYGCSLKNWANWIEEVTAPAIR